MLSKDFSNGTNDLNKIASAIRCTLIEISHRGKAPHIASAMSTVDILVAAYWNVLRFDAKNPDEPSRDRLIFSKGHSVVALYSALGHLGAIGWDVLRSFNEDGSPLAEHPGPNCAPGIELATGSLGHGLPVGLGIAKAAKIQGQDYRVFVLIGDGECNEGSVWEAALLAPVLGLDNLCVLIDYNKWQATGRSQEITAIDPLADKWASFGWEVAELDGHDIAALTRNMARVPFLNGKPYAIIAHTVKGKGVTFMEDDNNWHYKICDADSMAAAFKELGF